MSQLEPYLPDSEVQRVQSKLYDEFPQLVDWNTDFATARISPPWHGQLPDGTTGWTKNAVIQFVVVSDHPRPLQRKHGVRHGTVASAWQEAFEATRKEGSHYVIGEKMDPLEAIFRTTLNRHLNEMKSLSQIIRDAIADPSKPKSALDAL